jgi:hypothetical protein
MDKEIKKRLKTQIPTSLFPNHISLFPVPFVCFCYCTELNGQYLLSYLGYKLVDKAMFYHLCILSKVP